MDEATFALETTSEVVDLVSLPPNKTGADGTSSNQLQYVIWVYVLPVVLLVGVIGNVLSIVVLQTKPFRHTTTGVYLPLTAIADCMFLLTGALEILEITGVFNAREYNVWSCRMYKVLHYSAGDISIWLLVAFTFDRFVAVCFPLSKRRVCKWKRAVIAAVTIVLLSLAKNFHEFWTRGPEYRKNGELRRICGSQKQYEFFLDYIRPWLVLVLVMAVPFILILVFNCSIVVGLLKAKKVRDRSISVVESNSTTGSKSTSGFRQTAFMCLGISIAFLICIAPSIVLLIGKPYWKYRTNEAYNVSKAISNFLVFVNHSINFFLYCVTGQRFRDELRAMITCKPPRRGSQACIETPVTPAPRTSRGMTQLLT